MGMNGLLFTTPYLRNIHRLSIDLKKMFKFSNRVITLKGVAVIKAVKNVMLIYHREYHSTSPLHMLAECQGLGISKLLDLRPR